MSKSDGWGAPRVGAKRGALILAGGSAIDFVLKFLRSVLLARLLTVSDFGIVGTFMAALSLLQMISNFNFGLLLVQHKRGNALDFAAAIKGLGIARALVIAAALFLGAEPLARLMAQPDLAWAYRCLAIMPLLTIFQHNDATRFKRQMRFGPQMAVDISASLVTLLMIWPLVIAFGDYRAALVMYAVQGLMMVMVSHMVAEYPFRVSWDWEIAKLGIRFGWPLMLSGLVLFAILQGDRIIVANFYGNHALGLISAVLVMVMTPLQFAGQLVRTYFLPILSRHQSDPAVFDDRAAFTLQSTLCTALFSSLAYAVLGPFMLVVFFGEKFAEGGAYVALLGIAFSLQLLRAGSTTVAMARGRTINMLFANILRVSFVGPAVAVALQGADITSVIAVGVLGQVCAIALSVGLLYLQRDLGRPRLMVAPYLCGLACLATLTVAIWQPDRGFATFGPALVMSGFLCAATIASSRIMLRHLVAQIRGMV